MIVYVAIGFALGYAIYKERQALGCPTIPNGTDCDNPNGKAVSGTRPRSSDTIREVSEKIKKAANFADRWVTWRIAFLSSVPCAFLTNFIINKRLPTEQELIVNILVITSIIYFVFNFYKFHLIDHARNNIILGTDIIMGKM